MMTREEVLQHGVSQLPKETDKAFAGFVAFLNIPVHERTLVALSEQGWSWNTLARWSSDWKWRERAKVFDASMELDALNRLLSRRFTSVLDSLEKSLDDVVYARQRAIQLLRSTSEPDKFAVALNSRIEVDRWMSEIVTVLNTLGDRHAEAED